MGIQDAYLISHILCFHALCYKTEAKIHNPCWCEADLEWTASDVHCIAQQLQALQLLWVELGRHMSCVQQQVSLGYLQHWMGWTPPASP